MKKNEALIVIDVQNEYFEGGKMPITYPENSFDNIKKTMHAARENNIPIILIQHTETWEHADSFRPGTYQHEIHPEVLEIGGDVTFEKHKPSSFHETGLDAYLKGHHIDTITICGYMTQMCCDTTARQGAHMGYQVNFLSDATGTLDFSNNSGSISAKTLHEAILVTQAFAFSKVMTADEWINTLS